MSSAYPQHIEANKFSYRQMGDDWMGIPAGRYGSGARMLIKGVGGEVILLFYFFFI